MELRQAIDDGATGRKLIGGGSGVVWCGLGAATTTGQAGGDGNEVLHSIIVAPPQPPLSLSVSILFCFHLIEVHVGRSLFLSPFSVPVSCTNF